jgi:glycosyltransferase involved in cell wall biosynthesis
MMAAYFAWKLRVPLAASWHTNVHEYLARRMQRFTGDAAAGAIEAGVLEATSHLYRLAQVLYAPNAQLCALLEAKTDRPCFLMQRGVDAELFTPAKRTRAAVSSQEGPNMVLGFVGRLSVEKNVALLPRIDAALRERGIRFSWLIIGHGDEEGMLRRELHAPVEFAGVLRGEALATAYANMDLLVFPSHTDTFGNVVLEALASGVPAIVTPDGGPATIVQQAITGRVASDEDFATVIVATLADASGFARMRQAAREHALACTWEAVFDGVIAKYPQRVSHTASLSS